MLDNFSLTCRKTPGCSGCPQPRASQLVIPTICTFVEVWSAYNVFTCLPEIYVRILFRRNPSEAKIWITLQTCCPSMRPPPKSPLQGPILGVTFSKENHNSCLFSDNSLKLDSKARPSLRHRSCPPWATPSSESQSRRPCTPRPRLLADRFVGAWKVKVNANERWHPKHDSVGCWLEPQKWK